MVEGTERAAPSALERLSLFGGCDPHERERAARLLHPTVLEIGDLVLEPGAEPRFVIVLRGCLRVTTLHGIEGRLGPGDVVGEIALLDATPITATVLAAQRSDVLIAGPEEFDRLRRIGDIGRRVRAVADARRDVAGRSIVAAGTVPVFVRAPRVMGRGAGLVARSQRRHRPVRLAAAGTVALAAVVVGALAVVGNSSTPVGIDQALARLDAAAPAGTPAVPAAPGPPGPAPHVAPPGAELPPEATPPTPVSTPTTAAPVTPAAPAVTATPTATAPPDAAAPTPAPAGPYVRPEAGVYAYATTGGERINVPNGEHEYPEETYGVVQHGDGCGWRLERLVLEEHTEHHERCSRPGEVLSYADGRRVSFFGQTEEHTYRCDPPAGLLEADASPGSTGSATCHGADGDRAVYRGRLVAREMRDVGGVVIEVQHLHIDVELTGRTRGSSSLDLWLDAATGLLVREERTTRADVDSQIGQVRYEEDATFDLLSLTPRR